MKTKRATYKKMITDVNFSYYRKIVLYRKGFNHLCVVSLVLTIICMSTLLKWERDRKTEEDGKRAKFGQIETAQNRREKVT